MSKPVEPKVKPTYEDLLAKVKHFEKLGAGLYENGLVAGEYSDVTVDALGKYYKLHRIVLLQNPYFKSTLQGNWIVSKFKSIFQSLEKKLELTFDDPNITQVGLDIVFARMYGKPDYDLTHLSLEMLSSVLGCSFKMLCYVRKLWNSSGKT